MSAPRTHVHGAPRAPRPPRPEAPPTELQQQALELIRSRILSTGQAPTVEEMAAEIGITKSGVFFRLRALARKGAIKVAVATPRGITVPGLRVVAVDESEVGPAVAALRAAGLGALAARIEGSP